MLARVTLGVIIALMGCSGSQQTGKGGQHFEAQNQNNEVKSGLQIENGPNRGLNYTDPAGTHYSYRNIPVSITNDSTVAIRLRLALSQEYDYPGAYGDQKYRVFILPKDLTADKITWDSLSHELGDNPLRAFFDRGLSPPSILNEILQPGEECAITIGTLYPRPTNCGVVPNALFPLGNTDLHAGCGRLSNPDYSRDIQFAIGLKLSMCHSVDIPQRCFIVNCGQFSYPDQ